MQEPLPACCHRRAVFLASLFAMVVPAGAVRAEALVTGLIGEGRPGTAIRLSDPGSPVAYRSGRRWDEDEMSSENEDADPDQVLQLLAALLVVPAGCTPTYMNTNSSNPTSATTTPQNSTHNSSTNPPGDGGGGGGNPPGDLAPEPGGLVNALLGAGLAGLEILRRRRRLRLAC
jgi:hypothetical protein